MASPYVVSPSDGMLDQTSATTFDSWCRNRLYTAAIVRAAAVLEEYCDLQLEALYRQLDLASSLSEPRTAAEVAAARGYVPSADVTVHAMLHRLSVRRGVVEASGEHLDARFRHVRSPGDPAAGLAELREQMAELGPQFPAGLDFLDFGVQCFERALRDEPDFMDKLLSGRDPTFGELWHAATNLDPLQDLHGVMGAEAIARRWSGGTVLEIGGGTGNGIRHVLRRLAEDDALDRLESYVFTDISTRFLMSTRKEISREHPLVDCEWKFLDINEPLRKAKIPTEGITLVYGVNAAHVAEDVVRFLRDCHDLLEPGGMVMFAERVRIDAYLMAPRELTLNLSVYHRSAAMHSETRPMHCYLSPQGWTAALEEAGFEPLVLPDLDAMHDHFPQQYAAVVVGHKAR